MGRTLNIAALALCVAAGYPIASSRPAAADMARVAPGADEHAAR